MNLPNKLTSSRFFFALLVLLFLLADFRWSKTLALLLFGAAALTDALDGHLARTKYGVSNFGKLMDPLADKVLVAAVLVGCVSLRPAHYLPGLPWVPASMVVIILSREFLVTGLRLLAVEQGRVISAGTLGKWKTILQMTAIVVTLLGLAVLADGLRDSSETTVKHVEFTFRWLVWFFMGAATVLTLLSGWEYFQNNKEVLTS